MVIFCEDEYPADSGGDKRHAKPATEVNMPRKRKRDNLQEGEASSRQDFVASDDSQEDAACDAAVAPEQPRFQKGQRVICNLPQTSPAWKLGRIEALFHTMEDGETVPYMVKLDNGQLVAPDDDDDMIRLAARACSDKHLMLAFAVPQSRWKATNLRFAKGDRVAVHLGEGIWERGDVIEVWAQLHGKKGVPYSVNLDFGGHVLIPFDSEEVIRTISDVPPSHPNSSDSQGAPKKQGKVLQTKWSKKMTALINTEEDEWGCEDCDCGFEHGAGMPMAGGHSHGHGHGFVEDDWYDKDYDSGYGHGGYSQGHGGW